MTEHTPSIQPVWCLVANVRRFIEYGPLGEKRILSGTKHFSGGTKVYCFFPGWDHGRETIFAVGRHRGSKKFVTLVMPVRYLTNWRAKLVYSPAIIERLVVPEDYYGGGRTMMWNGSEESKKWVESWVEWLKKEEASDAINSYWTGMEPELSTRIPPLSPALGQKALLDHIKSVLHSKDRKNRYRAIGVLKKLNVLEVVPMLTELMNNDPVRRIRQESASALRRIGTLEALTAVEEWERRQVD